MTTVASEPTQKTQKGADVSEEQARQVAEAARETEWTSPSFVRELFNGKLQLDLIHPHPRVDPDEQVKADKFLKKLEAFLKANVDAAEIDRNRKIPANVIEGLKKLGCFGIKIPEEYGGLGLKQTTYNRAVSLAGSYESSIGVLLSAHQSIGVPQPLKMFGTEEQKKKYLPRLAAGEISAFALTEDGVGSDPARMETTATLTDDGEAYILNGDKLWCTNGTIADIMVVMAKTGERKITAFIVETAWEGVEVVHRCEFMGLKGIENAVMRFTNVRVPKDNLLWGEGKGLKLALITLNTGRLTIPASAAVAGKMCTTICRKFASERVHWGRPVGEHDAIAQLIGNMASLTFAMEAQSELAALMADMGTFDIRLEAAMAKMWNSERGWEVIDDTMQIRSGRGYETEDSLNARGERPDPVERMMRDFRINLIFEGSSEIMRLFIAREVVDDHLKIAGAIADPKSSFGAKIPWFFKAGLHYAFWYPAKWLGWSAWPKYSEFGPLAKHIRYVDRTSRRLARTLFHAILRFGPGLEKRQSVLFRMINVGSELFAQAATCSRAHMLHTSKDPEERAKGASAQHLADLFCLRSRRRIDANFRAVFSNEDVKTYKTARRVLGDEFKWLEEGTSLTD
jgi:alkylation response protein AidB-like acyl-CoA dehydrogenase